MTRNVLFPLTRCFWGTAVPCPTPWHSLPNSLQYEVFQISLYLGWLWRCRKSRVLPVSLSRTGIAAKSSGSGMHHRSMSALGYLLWEAWAGSIVRVSSMFQERVRCATGPSGDVVGFGVLGIWQDRVRAATGWVSVSTGSCTLGSAVGITLGGGACALGDGGSTLGDGCRNPGAGWCVVGYKCVSHLSFIVGTGGGGGSWYVVVMSPYQLPSAFWRAWIASNWSLEFEGGYSYKAEVSYCIPWSTLSLAVTEGWVRFWWRNSMVSEIDSARKSFDMNCWQR